MEIKGATGCLNNCSIATLDLTVMSLNPTLGAKFTE